MRGECVKDKNEDEDEGTDRHAEGEEMRAGSVL